MRILLSDQYHEFLPITNFQFDKINIAHPNPISSIISWSKKIGLKKLALIWNSGQLKDHENLELEIPETVNVLSEQLITAL